MLRKCSSSFSHLQLFNEDLEKSLSKENCLLKEQKESFYQNSVESCSTDSMYLALDQQELLIKENSDMALEFWGNGNDRNMDYGWFIEVENDEIMDERMPNINCSFESAVDCKCSVCIEPSSPKSVLEKNLFHEFKASRALSFCSFQLNNQEPFICSAESSEWQKLKTNNSAQ